MNLCDFMLFADYAYKCLLVELTQMFLSKQVSHDLYLRVLMMETSYCWILNLIGLPCKYDKMLKCFPRMHSDMFHMPGWDRVLHLWGVFLKAQLYMFMLHSKLVHWPCSSRGLH